MKDLVVSYGRGDTELTVLKGVNLSLENEKVVIVGPNGSGKSTLFKAVLGLAPIKKGSVRVFGKDVRNEWGDVRVSTNIADTYRLAMVPCRDIVSIYAELKGGDPKPAIELIHRLEIDSVLGQKIHELSTGQQKLFGDVMAVSFGSRLVLLDEPFDNVDEGRRRKFVEVLKEMNSEIILITHELNLLSRLKDWGLYINLEGKLWGKFDSSQLERLYLTKGETKDALQIMDTSLGKISVTLDHGDVAVTTASNMNALLEKV